MVKKFFCLLILVFTLQVGWSVAGDYCGHETGTAAQHFGHHDHKHQMADEHQQPNKKQIGDRDLDCDYCHHSCASALSVHVTDYVFPAHSTATEASPRIYHSYIPEGLTRPNWRRVS